MIKNTLQVTVDESSSIEKSLRKFKKMCDAFGVVKEYRKRKEYKKPSVKEKEKLEAAAKRRHKAKYLARTKSAFF